MKIAMKPAIGLAVSAPTAEALGDCTTPAAPTHSPLDTAAAAESAAVHANTAPAGPSTPAPLLPEPSHDTTAGLTGANELRGVTAEIAAAGAGTPVDPHASTGTSSESRTTATSDGAVPRRATTSPPTPASTGPPPREPCRFTGALAGAEPEASRGEVSEDADEPAEPVLSAHAVAGNAAITPPTPNATANAPTRPTYRE